MDLNAYKLHASLHCFDPNKNLINFNNLNLCNFLGILIIFIRFSFFALTIHRFFALTIPLDSVNEIHFLINEIYYITYISSDQMVRLTYSGKHNRNNAICFPNRIFA